MLHNPKLIILNEPFYGLDVKHVKEIKEIIDFLHDQGITIFMTSDNLKLSASLSTAIGIMEGGTMLVGEKVKTAYSALVSQTRMQNMTVRNEMIKERTINLFDDEDQSQGFDFKDVTSEYKAHNEITKNPDINHTMTQMPNLNNTMHQMPDLSHTMTQMPNLNNTMHQMPDLSHTMTQMPNLNNTMYRMPPVIEPIQMPYEELQKIHNSRTGEDLSNRIQDNYGRTQENSIRNQSNSNRLHVEKRGAGGSRVVTNKNNMKKK
jgi:ABC-type glutathione transport system ATPase component